MKNERYTTLMYIIVFFLFTSRGYSQSLEIMPGNNFVFTDIQFFKPIDNTYRTTLFSRTRARLTYNDEANGIDFFSGAYLNHTFPSGLGGTLIGRIDNRGSDLDLGIHFYKQGKDFSIFALPSISLSQANLLSWFSIFKYRPVIKTDWNLYTSLELFSVLQKGVHAASTQRIRIGLEHQSYRFGIAANISELGAEWIIANDNYGVFLQKEF